MFKLNRKKIILISVLIIFAFFIGLRIFYIFTKQPSVDEIAVGYEAFSILKTGADRNGNFFPAHFYNFGWGENITLSLILIPLIKLFGLSTLIVRTPVFIASLLSIFFTYLLGKELFNKKIGVISALLLTASPWHIYVSTTGYNVCLLPFFYTAIIYCLIKFFKEKKHFYFYISTIISAITFYTYALSFLWIPLIYLIFFFINKKEIFSNKKIILLNLLILIILISPIAIFYLQNQFQLLNYEKFGPFGLPDLEKTRLDMVSIFNNPLIFASNFIIQYFIHIFTLCFALMIIKYSFIPLGGIYFFEILFILYGIKEIIKKRKNEKKYQLLLLWFLLAPLPVCFTLFCADNPSIIHPLRSIHFLPLLQIIGAVGIYNIFFNKEKNEKHEHTKIKIIYAITIIMTLHIAMSFFCYYKHNNIFEYQKQKNAQVAVMEFVQDNQKQYDKIIISDDIRYLFFAFFLKIDPEITQKINNKNADYSNKY
ncbi:MAG: glycosyltransferase family 39 protein, partial [Patescibacteria group bacterium]|nr:glycosyltransferase family 39 protein [Patescibacteria group bacterium]